MKGLLLPACLASLILAFPAFAQPKKEPSFNEAQQIKLQLGPADANQLGEGPWGVSLSFYARFHKDGTVDRGNQGIAHDSVTNNTWAFHATLAPFMPGGVIPQLSGIAWMPAVTAKIEGQIASSYTDAEPEFSVDNKVITQKLTVRIERSTRIELRASLGERSVEFIKKERTNSVSFDLILNMKAGQFSVSAELPSKDSLGTDGWSAKRVTKIGRLANDPAPALLDLGSAKCRAELSTRKLPKSDASPPQKFPKVTPGPKKNLPKKLPVCTA